VYCCIRIDGAGSEIINNAQEAQALAITASIPYSLEGRAVLSYYIDFSIVFSIASGYILFVSPIASLYYAESLSGKVANFASSI
jgi:hypothetical protein